MKVSEQNMTNLETIESVGAEMMDWAQGRRSHWNEFAGTGDDPGAALMRCYVVDAMETIKLSSVLQVLIAKEVMDRTTGLSTDG
jgi:hypothetical protein